MHGTELDVSVEEALGNGLKTGDVLVYENEDTAEATFEQIARDGFPILAARDAGVKRVVYAASSSAYGNTPILPKHEDMPRAPFQPTAALI